MKLSSLSLNEFRRNDSPAVFVFVDVLKKEKNMQNKVSYIVIIVLAFVCLLLSMRLSHEGNAAKQAEPAEQAKASASESANSKDSWNGIGAELH